jgi:hypothetical protein
MNNSSLLEPLLTLKNSAIIDLLLRIKCGITSAVIRTCFRFTLNRLPVFGTRHYCSEPDLIFVSIYALISSDVGKLRAHIGAEY